MRPNQLVFDVETQYEFAEVGGRNNLHLLKVSVVGVYSYKDDKFLIFEEKDLDKFEDLILNTKRVIGFNIKGFDLPVLEPYFRKINIKKLETLDIMEDVINNLGRRIALDNIAKATLNLSKTADGLKAIKFFREGRIKDLCDYCLKDVEITRDLFEYGKQFGKIKYLSYNSMNIEEIPVKWQDVLEEETENNFQQNLFT